MIQSEPRLDRIVLALALLIGLFRFSGLNAESFWLDEAKGAELAFSSLSGWWDELPHHQAPPGHFLLLKWIGDSIRTEWALRLPSAIAGWLCILCVWEIAKGLGLRFPALPALLLATSPLFFNFSQEARCYTFWTLAELAAWTSLLGWRGRPQDRAAAIRAGFLFVLPLLLHYYALWFVLGRLPLALHLIRKSTAKRYFGLAVGISSGLSLPWLIHQIAAMPAPNPGAMTTLGDMGIHFFTRKVGEFFGFDYPLWAVGWVVLAMVFSGVYLSVYRKENDRPLRVLFFAGFVIPPFCAVLATVLTDRYLATRHLLPLLPISLIGLSVTIVTLLDSRRTSLRMAGICFAGLFILHGVLETIGLRRETDRPPWRDVSEYLEGIDHSERSFRLIGDNVSVILFYRDDMGVALGEAEIQASIMDLRGRERIQGILVSGQTEDAVSARETLDRMGKTPSKSWTSRRISKIDYYPMD